MALLPKQRFTPRVAEGLARLSQAVEFDEAVALLAALLGVRLSERTARRRAYAAGEAALVVEAAACRRVERDLPVCPAPPALAQVSLDATTVPLVGGTWTEVKLAAFADLVPGPPTEAGLPTVAATALSYVARWEPAEQFARTLVLEANRRGLDEAGRVVSPNDGAVWIQGALDLVAPQAVRILDEPHAAEHLATVALLTHEPAAATGPAWVRAQRATWLTDGPAPVLDELRRLQAAGPRADAPAGPDGLEPAAWLAREVAYFTTRADQIDYAAFRRQGYPIGSGIAESGHKVVVGTRFKGAGHHWAPPHLNPLLILRTAACNDRWAEVWPPLWAEQLTADRARRHAAQQQRRARHLAALPPPPAPPTVAPALAPPVPPRPKLVVEGRPTADHPWRKPFLRPRRRTG